MTNDPLKFLHDALFGDQDATENFSHLSHKSGLGGKSPDAQVVENKEFPIFPTFPTLKERPSPIDEFSSAVASRARNNPLGECARVESSVEKVGKWENSYFSRNESGKNGKSGERISDEAADLIALFEERAAIREFEGGFSRPTAQGFALDDCINELTGHSADRRARDEALDRLRAAGMTQPVLFPEGEPFDAPF